MLMLWFHEIPNVPFVMQLSGFVVNVAVKEYFYTYCLVLLFMKMVIFKLFAFQVILKCSPEITRHSKLKDYRNLMPYILAHYRHLLTTCREANTVPECF